MPENGLPAALSPRRTERGKALKNQPLLSLALFLRVYFYIDLPSTLITAKLTNAPGNQAPIGGLKVIANSGWFAARPSGTESIYKIYAESFKGRLHLDAILLEAQEIVSKALEVKP